MKIRKRLKQRTQRVYKQWKWWMGFYEEWQKKPVSREYVGRGKMYIDGRYIGVGTLNLEVTPSMYEVF